MTWHKQEVPFTQLKSQAESLVVNQQAKTIPSPPFLLQQDLDEMNSEAMMTEDKARRAMMDAAKLSEDLRLEQEHTTRADGERRAMEAQVKDLQVRSRVRESFVPE